MLDNPSVALYWCLSHAQRRQIAEEFGVLDAADRRQDNLAAARLWLGRLSACGSIVPALNRAQHLHRIELRRIETAIREYGAHHWRDELEEWREHKYRLLALWRVELEEWREHKYRLLALAQESDHAPSGPA